MTLLAADPDKRNVDAMTTQYAKTFYTLDPSYLGLRPVVHRMSEREHGIAFCRRNVVLDLDTLTDTRPSEQLYCKNCLREEERNARHGQSTGGK